MILACIMLAASLIFVLLSVFYYEYVPEGLFLENEDEKEEKASIDEISLKEKGEKNDAFEKSEDVEECDL